MIGDWKIFLLFFLPAILCAMTMFKITYNAYLHTSSSKALRQSVAKIKNSRIIKKAVVEVARKFERDFKLLSRSHREYASIHLREEGLLIKPLFSLRFALFYKDIIYINVSEYRSAFEYEKVISIYSHGSVMDTLDIITDNEDFISQLGKLYRGKVHRYDWDAEA